MEFTNQQKKYVFLSKPGTSPITYLSEKDKVQQGLIPPLKEKAEKRTKKSTAERRLIKQLSTQMLLQNKVIAKFYAH